VGDPIPASSVLPSAEAAVLARAAGGGGDATVASAGNAEIGGGTEEGDATGAPAGGAENCGRAAAGTAAAAGLAVALREAREVFRRSRELISDCECSVASLAAQLARRVDPDYAPRVAPEITTASESMTMIASGGGAGGGARDAPEGFRRRKSPA